jgi:Domain of unknown function (DUF4838)/Glycosyl hydrolase family 67 N-terminus
VSDEKIVLINEGVSNFVIYLSSESSVSEKFAAEELSKYIKLSTGAELKIQLIKNDSEIHKPGVILGNNSYIQSHYSDINYQTLGEEGFVFEFHENEIIIAGSKTRGTLYGVYQFLENYLNIRFYDPEFTQIPKTDSINVPNLSKTHIPAFQYRMVTYLNLLDPAFSVKLKVNMNPFAEDEHGGGYLISPAHMTHTFYQLVDPKKYFKEHPEYFALVDGERIQNMGQLCLTNPEVIKIATESVLRWFKEDPRVMSMGVVQNDVNNYCECDQCKDFEQNYGGVHIAPILNLCNIIAEKLVEKYPDKQKFVHTIAYTYSLPPPEDMIVNDNVMVVVCDMYPDCADQKPIGMAPLTENYVEYLNSWSKITKNLLIWHYCVDFVHFLMPFPNFHSLYENTKIYQKMGVKGILFQATTSMGVYGENEEFRFWFLHKLLWDTSIEYDTLIKDFINGYYGAAAPIIFEYFNELQALSDNPGVNMHLYSGLEAGYLTKEWIIKWQTKLKQALELVQNDEIHAIHVEKQLMTVDYTYLIFPTEYKVALGKIYAADLEYRKEVYSRFRALVKKFSIGVLGEQVPSRAFFERNDIKTQENSILGIAEIAPTVMGILNSMLSKVKDNLDEQGNFFPNNYFKTALKSGFHPLELNHWMNEKNIADWSPDVNIWTRKFNAESVENIVNPKIPTTKLKDLPKAIEGMIDGIPHQIDELE